MTAVRGEIIYLSEQKLADEALQRDLDSSWFARTATRELRAGLRVPLAPGVSAAASGATQHELQDPDQSERAMRALLARVLEAIESESTNLPHLDDLANDGHLVQHSWVRFRRVLRFGAAHADTTASLRAFVLVDAVPVPDDGIIPALMMTGAPIHVRGAYRLADLDSHPAARSGSGTDELFRWLVTIDAAQDGGASVLDQRPESRSDAAFSMYRLFAQEDWLPQFPQLLPLAHCEGVAKVSWVLHRDESTLVLASPLYVAIVPPVTGDADSFPKQARWRSLLRR